MSGTHYTEDDGEEGSDIDPLQVADPAKEVGRRRRVFFSERKEKEWKFKEGLDHRPRQNSARKISKK